MSICGVSGVIVHEKNVAVVQIAKMGKHHLSKIDKPYFSKETQT